MCDAGGHNGAGNCARERQMWILSPVQQENGAGHTPFVHVKVCIASSEHAPQECWAARMFDHTDKFHGCTKGMYACTRLHFSPNRACSTRQMDSYR